MNRVQLMCTLLATGAVTVFSQSWSAAASNSSTTSALGTIGIRLVPTHGESASSPLADSYIVDRLSPGSSLVRIVEIDNDTNAVADVSMYVAGADVVHGNFRYSPGSTVNELSSWSSLRTDSVRLAPHSESFDTVTIKVPSAASRGEQNAVVWASVSAPPPSGRGITLVSRVGVRMYVAIGPGGAPPSTFTLGTLTAARTTSGKLQLDARIDNTGKSTLYLSGRLTLSHGPEGIHAGPFLVKAGTLLAPGRSELATVQLDSRFPQGPWRVDLTVKSGFLQHSTIATMTFPHRYATRATTRKEEWSVALFIATISLLMIAAMTFPPSRRRWKRRLTPALSKSEYF
jgi:hypothetical protein